MKQRQNVEQPVFRHQRQHRTGVIGRETHARLRQRHHFRPRRRTRGQKDKGVIVTPRRAFRNGGPDGRADEFGGTEPFARAGHEIDDRDAELASHLTACRFHVGAGDKRRELEVGEIPPEFVSRVVGIDRDTGRSGSDRKQGESMLCAARHDHRDPIGRSKAEPAQLCNAGKGPLSQLDISHGRMTGGLQCNPAGCGPGMEIHKIGDA